MSHPINDRIKETISEGVEAVWMLPNRPDLREDCEEYIWDYYAEVNINADKIPTMVIEFLSKHCSNATSSKDIEHMSRQGLMGANYE
tara:strand:- start:294 stop:554 length:261 start_codon:yes stop_codon:yes gene_type:complete